MVNAKTDAMARAIMESCHGPIMLPPFGLPLLKSLLLKRLLFGWLLFRRHGGQGSRP